MGIYGLFLSKNSSGGDAAASLPAPAAALHVLEAIVSVAVVLALARFRPAALARVIADFALGQRGQVRMGIAEDAGGREGGEEDDEVELHFFLVVSVGFLGGFCKVIDGQDGRVNFVVILAWNAEFCWCWMKEKWEDEAEFFEGFYRWRWRLWSRTSWNQMSVPV